MRRLVLLLCVALAGTLGSAPAPARAATGGATAATKVTCTWVTVKAKKATKKRKAVKRHRKRVCVTRKTTRKPMAVTTPATDAPAVPAAAPVGPAATPPAISGPAIDDPVLPPALARLQVTSREWSLALSRPTVPVGPFVAQLFNLGEDGHDLRLRTTQGEALLSVPETAPGQVADAPAMTLAAGAYTLYCSLAGHEAAGMRATLTVVG